MKLAFLAIVAVSSALAGSAIAANILPGSGATVTGSSIHAGFDATIAAGNLINGTSNPAYSNTDPRWVFADGSSANQTLVVDLGSMKSLDSFGVYYNGQDRIPTTFQILTSTDNVNFTAVSGAGPSPVPYGTAGELFSSYSTAPVTARYVEYYFGPNSIGGFGSGGGSGQGAGIYQLSAGVPEPATWAMMLVGFFGLGAILRTSRRKQFRAVTAA